MRSESPVPSDSMVAQAPVSAALHERRLHPLSWLFVLLAQLREFAVPLIVLLLAGGRRSDRWELVGALGAVVLALAAVVRYYSYRFRIADDELIIRSGVFQRNLRHLPLHRIHNVALHQNILHRVFGVAEVRLESAGGIKPEAQMRVLSLADARALEDLVRMRNVMPRAGSGGVAPAAESDDECLLALPPSELLRLGLVSNRGMVVLAAAFGAFAQSDSRQFGAFIDAVGKTLFGWASTQHLGWMGWLLGGAAVFLLFALMLRLLSMALALVQFYGFVLRDGARRLSVETGLLTRVRMHVPRHRIQAWTIRESLLQRWLHRQSLKVDTASTGVPQQTRTMRDLAPIATPAAVTALLARLLPAAQWPELTWQSLHPRAWRRMLVPPTLLTVLLAVVMVWRYGTLGSLVLLSLPWWWWRARRMAAFAAYALSDSVVAVRGGWPGRYWRLAEIGKLQVLRLSQSPFDRRHGMATLWFDTAGAGSTQPPLCIRYLPIAQARGLLAALYARTSAAG